MSAKMSISVRVTDDKSAVLLGVTSNGKPVGEGHMDASEVTQMINYLMQARSTLRDQVPITLDPLMRLSGVKHPLWHRYPPTADGQNIAIRHPGVGWTLFVLAQAEAQKLAMGLLQPFVPKKTG
jgi:hypothetical protein